MIAIQNKYKLQPLSAYLNTQAPEQAPEIEWIPYESKKLQTIDFFEYANFMLSYTSPYAADKEMLDNAALIGVEAGKP